MSDIEKKYKELQERHKLVVKEELYNFLRWNPFCRSILGLLQGCEISVAKACEAIVEVKLGFSPLLPNKPGNHPKLIIAAQDLLKELEKITNCEDGCYYINGRADTTIHRIADEMREAVKLLVED